MKRIRFHWRAASTLLLVLVFSLPAAGCSSSEGEGEAEPDAGGGEPARATGDTTEPEGGTEEDSAGAQPEPEPEPEPGPEVSEPEQPAEPFECTAYQPTCVTDTSWATCNSTGTGHGNEYLCEGDDRCDPCSGTCKKPFCEQGDRTCVSTNEFQICNDTGTCWLPEVHACDPGLYCYEGNCQQCVPGQSACLDEVTTATCDVQGIDFVDVITCDEGLGCNEYSGKCADKVCEPGTFDCASITAFNPCLESGTGYSLDLGSCPKSEPACYKSECIPADCLPAALFLIDRSGSMIDKWDAVQKSVKSVILGNPDAAFGLLAFPVGTSCGTKSYPDLPLDFWEEQDLDTWFNSFHPGGSTPLQAALQEVEENTDTIFGVNGGTIIVLSDGQDTCNTDNVVGALGETTTALKDEHNIRTYVIGYNYQGSSAQLNAIASNGGTGYTSYIPAGSESELIDAISSIVEEVAQCLEE